MDTWDHLLDGSTKKILSLIKTLPDKDTFNNNLRKIIDNNVSDVRKRRRFNKHPRRISDERQDPLVVLKKPSSILTDSSDEYCDVTIRKHTVEEYDEVEIADHVLEKVVLEAVGKQGGKLVKEMENGARRLGKKKEKEVEVEEERRDEERCKPKEPPKLYIDRKLRGVIEKSIQVLQDIETLLNFGLDDTADGPDDFDRRRKRASEFSTRFSRIHLYQLNRHVSDLEDIVRPSSGKSLNKSNVFSLNQKFQAANLAAYQGLQAYHKHLPVGIVVGAPEKLRDFLKVVTSMCDLYKYYSDKHPAENEEEHNKLFENLETKCKEVADKVDAALSLRKPESIDASSSNVLLQGRRSAPVKRPKSGRQKKLSMYHTVPIRGDVYWKKAIAALSQKKFDVPSRYKTATFKHRPPPSPAPQPEEKGTFTPQKIHSKGDSKKGCKCKSKKVINDIDNVSTLVQVQNEKEAGRQESSSMWNLAQEFFDKVTKGGETMSQEQYECILDHFITMIDNADAGGDQNAPVHRFKGKRDPGELEQRAQGALERKLGDSIHNMKFDEFVEKFTASINKTQGVSEKEENSVEKKQNITITGAKNAPLICIKEDSPAQSGDECAHKENTEGGNARVPVQGQDELVYKERPESDFSKSISKLTRVQRNDLRPLEMLPKETVIGIIEYKLQFHKETKNNCMYKKSGSMSPLNLVERISDKLFDEVLVSITRDIQVEEILQKIYSQEFK